MSLPTRMYCKCRSARRTRRYPGANYRDWALILASTDAGAAKCNPEPLGGGRSIDPALRELLKAEHENLLKAVERLLEKTHNKPLTPPVERNPSLATRSVSTQTDSEPEIGPGDIQQVQKKEPILRTTATQTDPQPAGTTQDLRGSPGSFQSAIGLVGPDADLQSDFHSQTIPKEKMPETKLAHHPIPNLFKKVKRVPWRGKSIMIKLPNVSSEELAASKPWLVGKSSIREDETEVEAMTGSEDGEQKSRRRGESTKPGKHRDDEGGVEADDPFTLLGGANSRHILPLRTTRNNEKARVGLLLPIAPQPPKEQAVVATSALLINLGGNIKEKTGPTDLKPREANEGASLSKSLLANMTNEPVVSQNTHQGTKKTETGRLPTFDPERFRGITLFDFTAPDNTISSGWDERVWLR